MGLLSWFFKKDKQDKQEESSKQEVKETIKTSKVEPTQNTKTKQTENTNTLKKQTEEKKQKKETKFEKVEFKNTKENYGMQANYKKPKFNESTWLVKHFIDISSYYEWSKSILSMMCVKIGNIGLEEYKYTGFMTDLIKYIKIVGEKIIKDSDATDLAEAKIPGGVKGIKKMLDNYQAEMNNYIPSKNKIDGDSAEDDGLQTLSKDISKKELKDTFGNITKSEGTAKPDTPEDL